MVKSILPVLAIVRCMSLVSITGFLGGCDVPREPHVVSKLTTADKVVVQRYKSHGTDEDLERLAGDFCKKVDGVAVLEKTNTNSSFVEIGGWRYSHYRCVPDPVAQAATRQKRDIIAQAEGEARARETLRQQQQAMAMADEIQRKMDRSDSETCLSFGTRIGTPAYTDCRLKIRSERANTAAAQKQQDEARRASAEWQKREQAMLLQIQMSQEAAEAERQRLLQLELARRFLSPTVR